MNQCCVKDAEMQWTGKGWGKGRGDEKGLWNTHGTAKGYQHIKGQSFKGYGKKGYIGKGRTGKGKGWDVSTHGMWDDGAMMLCTMEETETVASGFPTCPAPPRGQWRSSPFASVQSAVPNHSLQPVPQHRMQSAPQHGMQGAPQSSV